MRKCVKDALEPGSTFLAFSCAMNLLQDRSFHILVLCYQFTLDIFTIQNVTLVAFSVLILFVGVPWYLDYLGGESDQVSSQVILNSKCSFSFTSTRIPSFFYRQI